MLLLLFGITAMVCDTADDLVLPCAMIHKAAVLAEREQHRDFLGRAAPEGPTRPGGDWFTGRGESNWHLGR